MSAIGKFKEYFGMSPVMAYDDEYLDDYDRPIHHDAHDRRGDYDTYRDEPLREEFGARPRRAMHSAVEPVDEYSEWSPRHAPHVTDTATHRPRRYPATEAPSRRSAPVAPVSRGSMALAPEEDFIDDGLVTQPETVVERPRGFGDGKGLGENFRAGRAVVLDLSSMARDDARRMVDFAAGLVFGLDGSMQKVEERERTFLLQPAGMDLTEAEVRDAVNAAFRRQA